MGPELWKAYAARDRVQCQRVMGSPVLAARAVQEALGSLSTFRQGRGRLRWLGEAPAERDDHDLAVEESIAVLERLLRRLPEPHCRRCGGWLDSAGRPTCRCSFGVDLLLVQESCPERPTGKQDLAIQARLADEFGLLNCWQAANPDQPLCQTLRWTSNPTIPYHCDGLFVPKAWKDRLVSCVVLAGDEWDRLSNHNPVVACFKARRERRSGVLPGL